MQDKQRLEEQVFRSALALDEEGRSVEALAVLAPLVHPRDNPRYLVAYAQCLTRAGRDWEEAVSCIRDALVIEPRYLEGPTRLLLADLLFHNGRRQQAIEQWRMVARMQPDGTGYGAVPDEAVTMLSKHDI